MANTNCETSFRFSANVIRRVNHLLKCVARQTIVVIIRPLTQHSDSEGVADHMNLNCLKLDNCTERYAESSHTGIPLFWRTM